MLGARRLGRACSRATGSTGPAATAAGTGPRSSAPAGRCSTSPSGRVPARADPVARQGPRAVGRAHVRRADAPVDGRQRDVRRRPSTIPTTRSVGPTACRRAVAFDLEWYATAPARAVPDGYAQDGVVHGLVELAGGPLHLTEVPARRWHRWGDALGAGRRAAGLRPHRAAGAVRVPRRHGRRLGAHPGRLALTGVTSSRSGSDSRPARAQRAAGAGATPSAPTVTTTVTASSVRTNGSAAARPSTMANTPPANALHPAAERVADPGAVVGDGIRRGRRRRDVDRQRRHGDAVGHLLLRGEQLLEHRLAVRQLGLDPHDRLDVDGVGVELADARDARPLVGDARCRGRPAGR